MADTRATSTRMEGSDSRPRSAPSFSANSTAIIQSSMAVPAGGDLLRERADATLEVRGAARLLTERGDGQHHIGLAGRLREERVEGDDRARSGQAAPGEVAIGEVGDGIDAEQDQAADAAGGRGLEDAGGIETRRRRQQRPDGTEVAAGVGQRGATRQHAGRQAHVERAADVAAAHGGQERGRGVRRQQRGSGIDGERRRRREVGAVRRWPPAFPGRVARARSRSRRPRCRGRRPDRSRRAPAGATPAHRAGSAATARRTASARCRARTARRCGRPAARRRHGGGGRGPAALPSGPARAARPWWRRRPRRSWPRGSPNTASAGRPSPSCASTWSVPMTPLASLAHA